MASMYSLLLIALSSLIYFNDGVKANCGGLIEEIHGIIKSPGYPGKYPPRQDCLWEIRIPSNKKVWFQFNQFQLESDASCRHDSVTLKSKMEDGTIQELGKFCDSRIRDFHLTESNILYIHFKSDGSKEYKGFEMEYSDKCGWLIEGGRGNITSPSFQIFYPSNTVCEWNFLVPPQHKIKLNILRFQLEGGSGCPSDYLQIKSNSTDGKILDYGKYCGQLAPFLITSMDGITLKFVSDRSIERRGFTLEYFIDELTESESSVLLETTTTPVYEAITTFENQHDDNTKDFVTSRNEENTFSNNYESTISSALTIETSTYAPNQPVTETQRKETENVITSITNILSGLTLLTKKVADIEERQILLFNNYENLFNKVLSSKNAFLEDKKFPFNWKQD